MVVELDLNPMIIYDQRLGLFFTISRNHRSEALLAKATTLKIIGQRLKLANFFCSEVDIHGFWRNDPVDTHEFWVGKNIYVFFRY